MVIVSLAVALLGEPKFPEDFLGRWAGKIEWIQPGKAKPQQIGIELQIEPLKEANTYTWNILYAGQPARNYTLRAVDHERGIWTVDEGGGVRLDQYWIGGELRSSFTVEGNTIIGRMKREGKGLWWELTTFGPAVGKDVLVSPLRSVQKGLLKRVERK